MIEAADKYTEKLLIVKLTLAARGNSSLKALVEKIARPQWYFKII